MSEFRLNVQLKNPNTNIITYPSPLTCHLHLLSPIQVNVTYPGQIVTILQSYTK